LDFLIFPEQLKIAKIGQKVTEINIKKTKLTLKWKTYFKKVIFSMKRFIF